jgi:DNA-binding transcriptional ArsR family regulator
LEDAEAVQALAHPVRLRVLEALQAPASAAAVARALGHSRQSINYHVKELERFGLLRSAGERRKGQFIEHLYQAGATTFLVSPRLGWQGGPRAQALRDQVALRRLIDLGDHLQRDGAALLDRAAFQGEAIASATVEAEVAFPDEASRSAFMEEYLALLGPLLKKHGAREGSSFRVAMAVYPATQEATDG